MNVEATSGFLGIAPHPGANLEYSLSKNRLIDNA